MIRHYNIEQKSLEWFELRWGKIGGSTSKGLFVKSDTLLLDILSQRLEEFEPTDDGFTSDAMERGNDLEPFAREYLETYTGLKFEQTGWLQCEENELLGISPDGITSDNLSVCEVKCFGRKKHLEVLLGNEIPLENIHQLVHYFTVNPLLVSLYFIAFRPEAPRHFIKELTRESQVNIGTKASPVMVTVADAVEQAKRLADELLKDIKAKETELSSI